MPAQKTKPSTTQPSDTRAYLCNRRVKHDGDVMTKDDSIELTKEQAQPLLENTSIRRLTADEIEAK